MSEVTADRPKTHENGSSSKLQPRSAYLTAPDCVDTGPILSQQMVPVLSGDTPATLHARIQEAERVLYPTTIAALARGEVVVEGRKTIWASH